MVEKVDWVVKGAERARAAVTGAEVRVEAARAAAAAAATAEETVAATAAAAALELGR